MKESKVLGPILIGIGIGLLVGVACESLLDGALAAVASFAGLLFVEVQPFARSLPAYHEPQTIGVGWESEVETDSGHPNPQTQPPRGNSFEVAPSTGKR